MDRNDPINFYIYDRQQQLDTINREWRIKVNYTIETFAVMIRAWAADRNILGLDIPANTAKFTNEVVESKFCWPDGGGTLLGQARKLCEESQEALEAAAAIEAFDRLFSEFSQAEGGEEYEGAKQLLKDAIGDTFVVLCILSAGAGLNLNDCIEHAWNEIKDRKGKMVDGKFVKEANLPTKAKVDDPNIPSEDIVYCVAASTKDASVGAWTYGPFSDSSKAYEWAEATKGIVYRLTTDYDMRNVSSMLIKDYRDL